eukprot:TRINITY_DN176_c0_g1_i6.p1 TRINITY_DN176_c0_g1~~TRINITY_DN176_c0_g1_i6.p1  ORF type:complete len:266 (+),score=55.21 TRINITY_DN176_c0_g1_i6:87-800(+)
MRLFLSEGASVAFTGRRKELGLQVQKTLEQEFPVVESWTDGTEEPVASTRCLFIETDHTKLEDCVRAVSETERVFGKIDILFNNAGIVTVGKRTEDITEEEWETTWNLNVTAVFRMTKHVLPIMRKNGYGAIVNNASDWAMVGAPDAMAYCTTKGAVVQMTRSVALDYAKQGIRANAVCPGDTFVKRWLARDRDSVVMEGEEVDDAEVERRLRVSREIPMGRTGKETKRKNRSEKEN